MMNEGFTLTRPEDIQMFRFLALRGALKLETLGMRRRGRPASVVIRELIGSTTRGKKQLLVEFEDWIDRKSV